ncbi:MAG: Uncharacterized protein G01um101472_7 [Parcubacteria group bacterium Gr01-1014_72]|nr:MAG: Uncharacterized protein G01um101472_7 [Parcubacteria group bacterium Gr01-1014_72]
MKNFFRKKFLLLALLGVLLGAVGFLPQSAHAQGVDQTGGLLEGTLPEEGIPGIDAVLPGLDNTRAPGPTSVVGQTGVAQKQAATAVKNTPPQIPGCITFTAGFIPSGINFISCFAEVGNILMSLVSRLVWLAGLLLDFSINSIINMDAFLQKIPVVDIGWRIFRDLTNILFIFILLYISIQTILGLGGDGPRKLVGKLIIIALLVNFSLFITKAVVDGTNIIAIHFYDLIVEPTNITSAQTGSGATAIALDNGIAAKLMEGLRIQTLYGSEGLGVKAGLNVAFSITLVTIYGSIFMLITAFVFFAGAIMFIFRGVMLMMLMATSPLAFAAWILPGLASYTSTWWKLLIQNALFAPAYLALTYVVISVVQSGAFKTGVATLGVGTSEQSFAAALTSSQPGSISIIVNFLILISLMMLTLKLAVDMGAFGAETFQKWGKSIQGLETGMWAAVGRQGLRGVTIKGESRAFQAVAKRIPLLNKLKGEWGVRKLDEKIGKSYLGSTFVGGKVREMTTGGLVSMKIGDKSVQEAYKEDKQRKARLADIEARDSAVKMIRTAERNPDGTFKDPAAIQRAVSQISLEGTTSMPKDLLKDSDVAQFLTNAQMDALMRSEDHTTEERKQYVNARNKPVSDGLKRLKVDEGELRAIAKRCDDEIKAGTMTLQGKEDTLKNFREEMVKKGKLKLPKRVYDKVRSYSMKEIEQMHWASPEMFTDPTFVSTLRYGIINDIRKSESFGEAEKENMRDLKNISAVRALDRTNGLGVEAPNADAINNWTGALSRINTEYATATPDQKKVLKPVQEIYEILAAQSVGMSDEGWEKIKIEKLRGKVRDLSLPSRERYENDFSTTQDFYAERGEEALGEALRGRSPSEIAMAPGRIWQQKSYLRRLTRTVLATTTMREKDTDDHFKIATHLLDEFAREIANPGNAQKQMTVENKDALLWLLKDRRGKEFFTDWNRLSTDSATQASYDTLLNQFLAANP